MNIRIPETWTNQVDSWFMSYRWVQASPLLKWVAFFLFKLKEHLKLSGDSMGRICQFTYVHLKKTPQVPNFHRLNRPVPLIRVWVPARVGNSCWGLWVVFRRFDHEWSYMNSRKRLLTQVPTIGQREEFPVNVPQNSWWLEISMVTNLTIWKMCIVAVGGYFNFCRCSLCKVDLRSYVSKMLLKYVNAKVSFDHVNQVLHNLTRELQLICFALSSRRSQFSGTGLLEGNPN